jgi:hypothetical protein
MDDPLYRRCQIVLPAGLANGQESSIPQADVLDTTVKALTVADSSPFRVWLQVSQWQTAVTSLPLGKGKINAAAEPGDRRLEGVEHARLLGRQQAVAHVGHAHKRLAPEHVSEDTHRHT